MISEQKEFVGILSDYINERESQIDIKDEKLLYESSVRHQLSAIVYFQLRNHLSKESKRFENSYLQQISTYVQRQQLKKKIELCLNDIPHIYVKGELISHLYPNPALRTMGDMDLLVHESNRSKAREKLLSMGCTFVKKGEVDDKYQSGDLCFEIHSSLVHPEPGKDVIETFFSNPWKYIKDEELDWNYHFIFLIAHMRYHFVARGIGFRQFMDVALLIKKKRLDWTWITEELDKLNLLIFCQTILALNEIWFDIHSPIENMVLSDNFVDKATDKIYTSGVFGFDSDEAEYNPILSLMKNKNISCVNAKIQYFLYRVFPTYESMSRSDTYCYVKIFRPLLIVAWIHRLCNKIFDKDACNSMKKIANIAPSKTLLRNTELEEWGL